MPKAEKLAIGFLYDDTLDSNDGVAQQVKRLGEWLGQNGHQVVYLCGESTATQWAGGKVYSLARNIKVKFNGNRLSMPLMSSGKQISAVLAEANPDVLHVQMPYSPVMSQRAINRAYKTTGIVGTFHILPSGFISSFGARLLRLIQGRSLKKINVAIAVSQAAADFEQKTLGLSAKVIPNMVDLAKFRQNAATKQHSNRIVFLGRLVKRKGCEELIRAFSLLTQTNSDAELVIAGDGAERPMLEKLVASLDLANKVTFLGFIKEEDKSRILGEAAIACFPSLYGESFGIVLIEAMAAGSGIVLAGNNPGYTSVMGEQPKLLVDPTNTKLFAERLAELLDDKQQAAQLHNWQESHIKQYDVNVVGQQILAAYQEAIAKKTKTRDN